MPKVFISFSILFSLLLSCCSPKIVPGAVKKESIRLAGRVQSVNEASRYVLIRRYGIWHLDENEIVESRGDSRTASLFPTGEKLGEHIAADIRSGEVEVGDAVYIRRISTTQETVPSEEIEPPKPSRN